jgi:hypothetical protein
MAAPGRTVGRRSANRVDRIRGDRIGSDVVRHQFYRQPARDDFASKGHRAAFSAASVVRWHEPLCLPAGLPDRAFLNGRPR